MWLLFAIFFFVLALCTKDYNFFTVAGLFAVAHNIEYLAIQVKNLKK